MPEHVRKMKASQLAHVQRLVLDLETLLGNTKRDVTETKKSIVRAEKRVSIFEELSRDLQLASTTPSMFSCPGRSYGVRKNGRSAWVCRYAR